MLDRNTLTWQERPLKGLLALAWPICVSMLSYSTMTVADTAFVGTLGRAALAGVGLAGTLAFAIMVFGIGLLRGVKVVISQAVGAGRDDRIDELAAAGLIIAIAMGLLVAMISQLVVLVVPLLAASEQAGQYGASYLAIRLMAAPLLFIFCTTREASYAVGDSRAPMAASVLANMINIGLDYLFIIELRWGPSGAAWATFFATAVEAGTLVWLRKAPGWRSLRQGVRWLGNILRVGLATGAQFAVEMGAFTLLTILIAAMSESEMAAHQVALTVVHFAFLPIVAISESGSVMAGQAVGANRDDLVLRVGLLSLGLALGYAFLCTLVLGFGASQIARGFTDDLGVIETAIRLLYVAAAFQLGDACNIIARGVLRGTGDVRYAAVVTVTASWLALPPLTWLLGHYYGLGAIGGWYGICVEIVASSCILWWRLWGRGWQASAAKSRAELASQAA